MLYEREGSERGIPDTVISLEAANRHIMGYDAGLGNAPDNVSRVRRYRRPLLSTESQVEEGM